MKSEILQLCRLCLVKDQANIPIFEEQDDRQILVKITACLPTWVSKDDNLPKKICDSCVDKLDSFYQFRNTTVNAEKQLLTWLGQAVVQTDFKIQADLHSIKQEELDPLESAPENSQNYVLHSTQTLPGTHNLELVKPSKFHAAEDERFQKNYFEKITPDYSGPAPAKRRRQQVDVKLLINDNCAENKEEICRPPITTVIVKSEKDDETTDGEDVEKNQQMNFISSGIHIKEQSDIFGMEDDDHDEAQTLPNVKDEEEVTTLNLLPVKSRKRYEKEYDLFMKWRREQNIESFSESVFLAYISELAKVQKSSTLWARYSMLKATLLIKNDIDISKYTKLMAFIKRQSIGYKPKKSKTFTKEHIRNFLSRAPDEEYLLMKVIAIIGLSGACRSEELKNMTIDNIQDMRSLLVINIPDSRTRKPRMFTVVPTICLNLIDIYRKYMSIRPINVEHRRLFLNYQKSKCTIQPVGINKISKIPTLIAKYLKLKDASSYTGHCWRRTSASVLTD